jgi:flagellar secretion chaperone FliS
MNKLIKDSRLSAKTIDSLRATPHQEVATLIDSTLEKISKARAALREHRVGDKGMYIGMSINLLDDLRTSLTTLSSEIVKQFRPVYEEMQYQLVQANLKNDEKAIISVENKLNDLKSNWESIPKKFHYVSNKKLIGSAVEDNYAR